MDTLQHAYNHRGRSIRRLAFLAGAMAVSSAFWGTLSAQANPQARPSAPASIMVVAPTFARWDGESRTASVASNVAVVRDTSPVWWGLGVGATAGATATLAVTQVLCADDNGCVGRSIGLALLGGLMGGAIESAIDY